MKKKKDLSDKEIKEWLRSSWDINPERYDSAPGFGTASEMEAWKRFFSTEFGDEKAKVLDVGTGTGFLSLMLAERGHDVVGVDMSKGMLSFAKRKAEERGLDIDLRIGDAESLDFEDESFDTVVSRWVLWTLLNPESAVMEWRRVVKTGGKIYAFTTNMTGSAEGVSGWLKMNLAMLIMTVAERKNAWAQPLYYDKEVEERLPLGYTKPGSRMDNMVKLFEQCGLVDVTVSEVEEVSSKVSDEQKKIPLRHKLVYKLAYNKVSEWSDWYCVSGRKPLTGRAEREEVVQ